MRRGEGTHNCCPDFVGILKEPANGDSRAQVPGEVNDRLSRGVRDCFSDRTVILLSGAPTLRGTPFAGYSKKVHKGMLRANFGLGARPCVFRHLFMPIFSMEKIGQLTVATPRASTFELIAVSRFITVSKAMLS